MRHEVTHRDLMMYLDGELAPEAHARIDAHIERCTECRREIAVFTELKGGLETMEFRTAPHRSIWDAVSRRLVQPAGWTFVIAGALVWAVYAVYTFVTGPEALWEKLATGAVWIGFAFLLASVAWERFRDWQHDPYREIER